MSADSSSAYTNLVAAIERTKALDQAIENNERMLAELRDLKADVARVVAERERLRAANAELLAACEADQAFWQHYLNCPRCTGTFFCHEAANLMIEARKLRVVAVAKAEGSDGP